MTNKTIEGATVTYGEFLRFIGIQLMISTAAGNWRKSNFWSLGPLDPLNFGGAPFRFNAYMSFRRYNQILEALSYADKEKDCPTYLDRFWEIRTIISMWNQNMKDIFTSSWINCLDESMSAWTNKWTCPGWIFCPRKPWPFGNEYHSICCGMSGIMFAIELVEGKDSPNQRPNSPTNQHGPTCGLLLRLCSNLYHSGKVVILDSGFCVLQGIIELRKVGVFATAFIKKRRYWPKYVPGDAIESKMKTKEIGETDSVNGKLDGFKYNLFAMKDNIYVVKLMATWGSLTISPRQESTRRYQTNADGTRTSLHFKYTQPFALYYQHRHVVDDHNNLRHSLPSIEHTWTTVRWANRVFAFLLSISEVNTYKAFSYFVWKNKDFMTLHQFRHKLALSLINNEWLSSPDCDVNEKSRRSNGKRKRKNANDPKKLHNPSLYHALFSAPPHARKYSHSKWDLSSKSPYQQFTCRMPGCRNKVRSCCKCSPGEWLCKSCFPNHLGCVFIDDSVGG